MIALLFSTSLLASSIDASIARFESTEQYCISGYENQVILRKSILKKTHKIAGHFDKHFQKHLKQTTKQSKNRYGQVIFDTVDKKWTLKNYHFKGEKRWLRKVKRSKNRCELLKLAYLYSIWSVTTLEPSFQYQDLFDHLLSTEPSNEELDNYTRDQRRASYAFRFLKVVPKELFPQDCRLDAKRSLLSEFELRFNFIFNELGRKPLGFALYMCGRPMNAHYIDEMVWDSRQEPKGWSAIKLENVPFVPKEERTKAPSIKELSIGIVPRKLEIPVNKVDK